MKLIITNKAINKSKTIDLEKFNEEEQKKIKNFYRNVKFLDLEEV